MQSDSSTDLNESDQTNVEMEPADGSANDESLSDPANTLATSAVERIASVDTLRGMVILLMVFVNDLGPGAPTWMHHIQPPDADGMTLADLVFPAFLFIVGISIPLAIERSLQLGKSRMQIMFHITIRTVGLLVMGLVGVNKSAEVNLPGPLWGVLSYIAIILAWCILPKAKGTARNILIGLKTIGVVGLVALLTIYRSAPVETDVLFLGPVENWTWLRTQWWGILGLIGWAYLTASVLYLILRQRREWLMGAMSVLFVVRLSFADQGLFSRIGDKPWLEPVRPFLTLVQQVVEFVGGYIDLGGATGSLAAISVAGSLLGTILIGPQVLADHRARIRWALVFALGLFIGGLVFDSFAGINKIAATPTWCLWCASLTCLVWTAVYRVMDVAGWNWWAIVARPAGANPLIAYLLHPIVVGTISVLGFSGDLLAYKSSPEVWMVVCGSAGMALAICALTGLIAKAGLRVRI